MKKLWLFLSIFCCCSIVGVPQSVLGLKPEIRTIVSLQEAKEALDQVDPDSLVVFDVDETLILAKDKIRRLNPKAIISQFSKAHFDDVVLDPSRKSYLVSIQELTGKQQLIEPESAKIIKSLQEKNVRVIALTHMSAGKFFAIESMEEWRFKQLYDLGINLCINNPKDLVLTNLPQGRVSHPVFYKGVLATSRSCTKGEALAELLKQLNWKPSKVIFFDDWTEHVDSVCKEMSKLGIPCTAFHYRATQIMENAINFEIAAFQYQYLIEHGTWLNEAEAESRMLKEKVKNVPCAVL